MFNIDQRKIHRTLSPTALQQINVLIKTATANWCQWILDYIVESEASCVGAGRGKGMGSVERGGRNGEGG